MSATHAAGLAFDALAPTYDQDFTNTSIGQAQRNAVLASAFRIFTGRERILELNCGTGEDASRMASAGWRVLALDASEQMIHAASIRRPDLQAQGRLRFMNMQTENVLFLEETFDGVFSNFSGLNCVEDLQTVAKDLARITTAATPLVLCLSTRFCLWETLWNCLTLQPRKAFRRWSGTHHASLRGNALTVYYPLVQQIRTAFAPHFTLERIQAIGLFVPPSYLERQMARAPRLLRALIFLDEFFSCIPGLRLLGDHMLLTLRKTEEVAR